MAQKTPHRHSSRRKPKIGDNVIWSSAKIRCSDAFESFYKGQQIVPTEEWEQFLTCLQSDLPTAFRIVTITPHRYYVHKFIQRTMESLQEAAPDDTVGETEGHTADLRSALKPIEWYKSGKDAFQLEVSRLILRSCKPLLSLHRFLVVQSEAATIFRQEAVSMIPAIFLEKEMRGDSLVLDMCAAPGSKTSQLLEALHKAAERERQSLDDEAKDWPALPSGAIVANDADATRSHMLVHHLRHLHSPCLLVTSHAAQFFPTVFQPACGLEEQAGSHFTKASGALSPSTVPCENSNTSQGARPTPLVPILFDRVLCDVPCSGDGTLRKSRALWASWSPHQGLGCHRLQVQILLRGIKLCKIGGRIVYSTCTFNPIENEAVVNTAVTKSRGAVVLEDCTQDLPSLKRSPGMSHWRVQWEGSWYDSFEEVPKTAKAAKKLRPSMFPPGRQREAMTVPLHHCMRFFPHVNNTGGFFVAVMRKVGDVPLVPLSSAGSDKVIRSEAASGSTVSETAEAMAVADNPQDDSDDEEEQQVAVAGDSACTVGGSRGSRPFDQMQLDMICLDWNSEVLERQHQQLVLREESLLNKTEQRDEQSEKQKSADTLASKFSSDSPKRQAPVAPLLTPRIVLKQAIGLVFHTLNLPEAMEKCNGPIGDLHVLYRRLCSLLYFRVKRSDSTLPDGGDPSDADQLGEKSSDQCPRRVFLVSQGVKRIVESVGTSRYKIINGGCLAFQARCKGVYRVSYGGAQWLAPFYEASMQLATMAPVTPEAPTGNSGCSSMNGTLGHVPNQPVGRYVFDVPCKLLYTLVATENDQWRVDLCTIEKVPFGDTLLHESSEGPLLLLARLPFATSDSGCRSTKIAIPAWRARTNVQVMLDPNTRCALKCLMDECGAGDSPLTQ